ncbi:PilW family protein [Candidatus Poribacteria bacterium]
MFIAEMRDSKGMTLVEIFVVMSLVLIGVLGAYSLLANIQATQSRNVKLTQAQQEARNIVEHIVRDLRESSMDQVWIDSTSGEPDSILFFTPRDGDRAFNISHEVDDEGDPLPGYGRPVWQRTVAYSLDSYSHYLYRYEAPMLMQDINMIKWSVAGEVVSKRVEKLLFSRVDDMITISIRTAEEPNSQFGYVAESYADYYTMVEFRN